MKKGWQFVGWFIGAVSLYVFFFHFFHMEDAKRLLANAKVFPVLLSLFSFLSAIVLRSIKWTFIILIKDPVRWKHGYHTIMISNLVNFLFPVRFGEIAKVYLINRAGHVPYSTSVSAILTDRFSQFLMILVFLLFMPFAGFRFSGWSVKMMSVFMAFILITFCLFFCGIRFLEIGRRAGSRILRVFRVNRERADHLLYSRVFLFLEDILRKMDITMYRKRDIFIMLFFSFFIVCMDGAYYYFGIQAFGLSVSLLQAILGACLMNLMFVLPTPPGQLGTAEMYPVIIFSWGIGLASSVISSTAIFFHLVSTGVFVILGISSLLCLDLGFGALLQSIPGIKADR